MRARDGEGAKSCGSDRFVVVSAVTSSCELGDLLLHAETAGQQLITDIVNVPLVCAMKVLNLINDGSCTFLFFRRASIVDWYQYESSAASALQECFRACLKCTAKMIPCQSSKSLQWCCSEYRQCRLSCVMQLSSVCSQQGRHKAAHGAFGALL